MGQIRHGLKDQLNKRSNSQAQVEKSEPEIVYVDRPVEVFIDRTVEKIVEKEVFIDRPIEVIKEVEKIVEKKIASEKEVVYVDRHIMVDKLIPFEKKVFVDVLKETTILPKWMLIALGLSMLLNLFMLVK